MNSLNTEYENKFDYKELRLTDDYQYPSEEEQEESSEKQTKTGINKFNKRIAKKKHT